MKRFVFTSSFASIVNPYDPVYTFTEKDWNEFSPKQVEEKGKDVDGGQAYRASKVVSQSTQLSSSQSDFQIGSWLRRLPGSGQRTTSRTLIWCRSTRR